MGPPYVAVFAADADVERDQDQGWGDQLTAVGAEVLIRFLETAAPVNQLGWFKHLDPQAG